MEMVLNDRRLTAEEALRFGLVNHVAPVESYLQKAIDLAAQIAARAPVAVRAAKDAVNMAFEASLSAGLAYERNHFYALFANEISAKAWPLRSASRTGAGGRKPGGR